MAPRHTRRPRSVTEQPPLAPVRLAAGARNHRWTSEQRNISAPRSYANRRRNPASRRQRRQASERGVSSPGGTAPGQAFHWWRLVVQGGYRSVSSSLVWRSSSSAAGATDGRSPRAIQLDGLPRRSYLDRPRPPGVGGSPSAPPSTGGPEALVDGVGVAGRRDGRGLIARTAERLAARSPHRLAGLPASRVAARRGVHSSNDCSAHCRTGRGSSCTASQSSAGPLRRSRRGPPGTSSAGVTSGRGSRPNRPRSRSRCRRRPSRSASANVAGLATLWRLATTCHWVSSQCRPRRAALRAKEPGHRHLESDSCRSDRFQVRACETTDGISPSLLSHYDLAVVADRVADRNREGARRVRGIGQRLGGHERGVARSGRCRRLAAGRYPCCGRTGPLSEREGHAARAPDRAGAPVGVPSRGRRARRLGRTNRGRTAGHGRSGGRRCPGPGRAQSGKGRVVALALGNDLSTLHESQYRVLLARSGEWAATGAVTLPRGVAAPAFCQCDSGAVDHRRARPRRGVLLALPRHQGLGELPVDTAANAFKKDLRDKYDVDHHVRLHARPRRGRQEEPPRLFVESGKGIVVLHHALLNFQNWSWWSEEVVGGRYRLQRGAAAVRRPA